MRIISGEFRGRKLLSPRTLRIRPTSDRVRESLFNILGEKCIDAKVLDLFAGVGTVGIEALSRGAASVTFVDQHLQSVEYIRKNIEFFREKADIIPTDTKRAIHILNKKEKKFDLIFLDPPYELGWIGKTLKDLDAYQLMKDNGMLIIQRSRRESIHISFQHFSLQDERTYGDTVITFMRGKE